MTGGLKAYLAVIVDALSSQSKQKFSDRRLDTAERSSKAEPPSPPKCAGAQAGRSWKLSEGTTPAPDRLSADALRFRSARPAREEGIHTQRPPRGRNFCPGILRSPCPSPALTTGVTPVDADGTVRGIESPDFGSVRRKSHFESEELHPIHSRLEHRTTSA